MLWCTCILTTTDAEEKCAVLLSHPDQYIGALLGHEGPGSLLSYYKAKVIVLV
jgi:secreted Zn-dependent insulinase-like peptidase